MNNYLIRKLLTNTDIENIKNLLNTNEWVDGEVTNKGDSVENNKNNLQLPNDSRNRELIYSIVMNALDNDIDFYHFCTPKITSKFTVAKYLPGAFYNIHNDLFSNGSFSTTVFLSDPSTYSGGELCLYINDEEIKIKPEIGYAVTYHTGIPHKVNKVISGERLVSVFWTTPFIHDWKDLEIYRNLMTLKNVIKENFNSSDFDMSDYYSAMKNPIFLINSIEHDFMRKYIH